MITIYTHDFQQIDPEWGDLLKSGALVMFLTHYLNKGNAHQYLRPIGVLFTLAIIHNLGYFVLLSFQFMHIRNNGVLYAVK